ncbi:'Cold-shock' DNA-binding domain-containing protein [Ruaniaceae bacterium KH17]|nr:'Cold-shock' DNA-binding domain-containing protein [Ruaniaceae bacterium KH17]
MVRGEALHAHGRVTQWDSEAGWGVLDLDSPNAKCFVHFANVPGPGFRELTVGEFLDLEIEEFEQDGCPYRAVGMVTRR